MPRTLRKIALLSTIGARGSEIIPEQSIPGFPHLTDEFVANWLGWMDKYGTTPVTGFAAKIDYTASATWNSVTATIDTASASSAPYSGTAAPVATAFSGSLSVSIVPTANSLPLLAGSYSDTLHVVLTPQ